jgi:large subunit ribosomal protein L23
MIILSKITTEKSTRLEQSFVYSFAVAMSANKHSIAEAIFQLYGVRPLSVRTSITHGKQRRVGRTRTQKQLPDEKMAYVTMKEALGTINQSAN